MCSLQLVIDLGCCSKIGTLGRVNDASTRKNVAWRVTRDRLYRYVCGRYISIKFCSLLGLGLSIPKGEMSHGVKSWSESTGAVQIHPLRLLSSDNGVAQYHCAGACRHSCCHSARCVQRPDLSLPWCGRRKRSHRKYLCK